MGLSYDFDIHWLVPRELYSNAQACAFEEETGETADVRGTYRALFRETETASALLGSDEPVRRFFEAAGFGFNVYDSGAPAGRYPQEDETAHIDVIERLTGALPGFDPEAHNMNGFDFEMFLEHLATAEPWVQPAPAAPKRTRRALPVLPLKAAAVLVAVIGSALLWQTGGDLISGQFDTGFLHAFTRGGE
ncbi:MAG: hypothetical protein AAGK37_13670 [Pseudomonadota bacterium]